MKQSITLATGVLLIGFSLIELTDRSSQIIFASIVLCCSVFGVIFTVKFQERKSKIILGLIELMLFLLAAALSVHALSTASG